MDAAPAVVLSEWLIVTAGLVVAVVLAASGNWLWRLDLQLHDVASSEGPRPVDPKIVIVAVDDASLAALGRWPWPRTTHARLLDRLGEYGAAGVAMDVIFAEAAPGDELLAEAMHRFGNVVLPVLQREQDGRIVGEAMPVAELMHEAAALGHIQVEFDPDGLARSVYLWEGWLQAEHPQLGLASAHGDGQCRGAFGRFGSRSWRCAGRRRARENLAAPGVVAYSVRRPARKFPAGVLCRCAHGQGRSGVVAR